MAFKLIKDKFLDQFGVMDDVNDFFEFLQRTTPKFQSKAEQAKLILTRYTREVASATEPGDLSGRALTRASKEMDALQRDLKDLERQTSRAISKARRDREIWKKVGRPLSQVEGYRREFNTKLKQAIDGVKRMLDDQKTLVERLRREESGESERRRLVIMAGRIGGLLAAVGYLGFLMARVAKGG